MSSERVEPPVKSPTRTVIIGALLIIAAALVALGIDYLRARHVELSEAPERQSAGLVLQPFISEFRADLTLPYAVVSRVTNDALRAQLQPVSGREEVGCVELRYVFKECLHFNWEARPSIPTPITFDGDGDLVRVNLSGAVDGSGGFGGEIANILGLDKKNFDAAFDASLAAKVTFDNDFCPVITPGEIEFGWTKEARIELIGRSGLPFGLSIGPYNLDFGRHFNGPIREKLKEAMSGASIDCQEIRETLTPLWRKYAIPIEIEGALPLFLNIDPEALYVSGIQGLPEGVRTVVAVQARMVVETEKGPEDLKAEPLRNTGPTAETGSISLAVPLKVPYDMLEDRILETVGPESIAIPAGDGSADLTIKALDIYPAGERLALGVEFSADLPWRFLDTSGMIWITAKPVSEENGTAIRLQDLAVARQTDSPFWNVLTAGFTDILIARFAEDARYDLSGAFEQAEDALGSALADPSATGGVQFTLTDSLLYVGRIVPEDERLAVEAGFAATMKADLSGLKLAVN